MGKADLPAQNTEQRAELPGFWGWPRAPSRAVVLYVGQASWDQVGVLCTHPHPALPWCWSLAVSASRAEVCRFRL